MTDEPLARPAPGPIPLCAGTEPAAAGLAEAAAALLGGTAEGILRHAGRPVPLVPPQAP